MIEKDIRRLINLVEEKSEDQSPKQLKESTGATDYNPKSQGGTRKELLAKYRKTKDPKDAEAARKAGATQQELKQTGKEGVAEGLNEFAQGDFNGDNDNNDLQLYLNVAKKLNMKKYKPSTAHDLIAKKMSELVDAVDDEKVDWARHMARKAQGLPSMLDQQGVTEGSEEKDPVWNKGTPMPKDYTCHCGIAVHPSVRNPKAIHTPDCPYAKKQDMAEGTDDSTQVLSDIVANEDFDALYDLMSSDTEAGKIVQRMYNDVSGEEGLHPDDDFEKILSIVLDHLTQDYGQQNMAEANGGHAGSAKVRYTGGMHGKYDPTKKQASPQAHLDAAKYHNDEANKYIAAMNHPKSDQKNKEWYKNKIQHHKNKADFHIQASGQQGVAEGMDPNKRSRLDDLIDKYKDSVDPEYDSYGSEDHYDSDDIVAQIRSEFGDNIADQVEAGAEKMHFGRPGHKHGYDPLGWRKPIDRQTKAGKMFKQDSDYRKNMIKSRYKLSGKSATEESTTMESKSLIAQGINKILKR